MAPARYVLRYRGPGPTPTADVARVAELPATVVVEATAKMLLVESDPEAIQQLVDALPDWVMAPEQRFPQPDTGKRAVRPPLPSDPRARRPPG